MARTFDGVDDQVAFGSYAEIDDVSPWTAYALVRITANVVDERQILAKMNASFNGSMFIAASGGGGNNNKIFCLRSGSGVLYAESVAGALVVNTWRVIVTTWDGVLVSGLPKIYACDLGGTLTELSYVSRTGMTGPITDGAATLRAGARDPADATFFAGGLADMALWNRVLSAPELADLGLGKSPEFNTSGLVFSTRMTGTDSPEINTAGSVNGTVTGTSLLTHPSVTYPGGGGGGGSLAQGRGLSRGIGRGAFRGF